MSSMLTYFVDLNDVWMLQAGSGFGLSHKRLSKLSGYSPARQEHLERHVAVQRTSRAK